MYDNHVYRWRASIAVAPSELRDVRFTAIWRTVRSAIASIKATWRSCQAKPQLPSFESVRELIYDPERLDALFQQAATTPIDPSLPPVPIIGYEEGEAAYYYWAFRLFGTYETARLSA
jgi:hypothetical protein